METAVKKPDHIVFLRGKRLYLRPVLLEDLPLFLKWVNDPDLRLLYMARASPIDEAEANEWLAHLHKRTDTISFVICTDEGRAIGLIGLHGIDWKSRVSSTENVIGEKEFWGKGYATEAKIVLLHYAFDTLNIHKIWGGIYSFNKASQAYNKKCGYKIEGVQRHQLFANGKYHDKILVAVFREDWLPVWKRFLKEGKV